MNRKAVSKEQRLARPQLGRNLLIVDLSHFRIRQREQNSLSATALDYLAAMRRLRTRQIRLAEFVWVVLSMELIFFIPWWVIGSRVHSRRITDAGSLLTMWLPIVVIVALYVWAFRLRAAGIRDVQTIDRLEADSSAM